MKVIGTEKKIGGGRNLRKHKKKKIYWRALSFLIWPAVGKIFLQQKERIPLSSTAAFSLPGLFDVPVLLSVFFQCPLPGRPTIIL